jgi:hypothetical protein
MLCAAAAAAAAGPGGIAAAPDLRLCPRPAGCTQRLGRRGCQLAGGATSQAAPPPPGSQLGQRRGRAGAHASSQGGSCPPRACRSCRCRMPRPRQQRRPLVASQPRAAQRAALASASAVGRGRPGRRRVLCRRQAQHWRGAGWPGLLGRPQTQQRQRDSGSGSSSASPARCSSARQQRRQASAQAAQAVADDLVLRGRGVGQAGAGAGRGWQQPGW